MLYIESLIISLILLILVLGVAGYAIYNLLRRNEVLEDLVNEQATKIADIRTTVLDVESKLVSLDLKGSFESIYLALILSFVMPKQLI